MIANIPGLGPIPLTCSNCVSWDSSTQLVHAQPDTTGACRHRAPVIDKITGAGRWPFTDQDDWCRKHEIDSAALVERKTDA